MCVECLLGCIMIMCILETARKQESCHSQLEMNLKLILIKEICLRGRVKKQHTSTLDVF